jgi:cytoskeleton protein RodZ
MTTQEAEVTELPASPGARLRREREARGLTEQQAAETLTLDPSVIFALEANDFPALGAPVFLKGHLRRYAALLGLPEDEVLGSYERSKQHLAEPSLVPKSRLEMMPVRGKRKWPWVLGGAVAFVLAALLAAYIAENGLPWVDRADDGVAAPTQATDLTGGIDVPAGGAGFAGPSPAVSSPAATAAQSDTPSPTDTDAAMGTADAVDPGGTPAAAAAGVAAVIAPGQVQLQLRFSGDSWVEVFDGSGRAVLYDLGKAGTERTLTATAPLSVTIGNAAAVAIAVNGRAAAAPRQSGQVMARFSVAPDGSLR